MTDDSDREESGRTKHRTEPARKPEKDRDRDSEANAMGGDIGGRLGDLDEAFADHAYPTTTDELVEEYGDYEIETQTGTTSLEDVLASTENQSYESADDVRSRVLGLIHR